LDELLNTLVKFKLWLQNELVGTAVLHGGIGEIPGDDNHNMPVRSRFVTNNGDAPRDESPTFSKKPEQVFGFRAKDRRDAKKRSVADVDRDKFPLDTRNPASVGLSQ
jgi:hypothetical protein